MRRWTCTRPCVHVSHRVGVGLLQPLVSGVEGLQRPLDLRSGLRGAAQAACDLQPAAVSPQQDPPHLSRPHLSVHKRLLTQTVNLSRGDGGGGAMGAQREAAQGDSRLRSSFLSQTQEVQERSTCVCVCVCVTFKFGRSFCLFDLKVCSHRRRPSDGTPASSRGRCSSLDPH